MRPVSQSSGSSLAKRPHLEIRTETYLGSRKSAGGSVSVSYAKARKMGDSGTGTPDVSQSTASSSSLSSIVQVGMLSHFLDQWRNITCNRFVLNMVQGYHHHTLSCFMTSGSSM